MHDFTDLTRNHCIFDSKRREQTTQHKNTKTSHSSHRKKQMLKNAISKILERLENIEGKTLYSILETRSSY